MKRMQRATPNSGTHAKKDTRKNNMPNLTHTLKTTRAPNRSHMTEMTHVKLDTHDRNFTCAKSDTHGERHVRRAGHAWHKSGNVLNRTRMEAGSTRAKLGRHAKNDMHARSDTRNKNRALARSSTHDRMTHMSS